LSKINSLEKSGQIAVAHSDYVFRADGLTATPRKAMSAKRRQAIFTEHCTGHNVAPCCLCGRPIHRHDDQWTIEHIRALGLLGRDINTNCAPAHEACRREKDKADLARIAKAKRMAMAGAKKEKPARGFQAPAGVKYDWRQRRYVRVATP
jgi:5-methylcytosine-specific restriction endonuclease McrA